MLSVVMIVGYPVARKSSVASSYAYKGFKLLNRDTEGGKL